jgi:hypothetical protein
MKHLRGILFGLLLTMTGAAYAHPDHDEEARPINEQQASTLADRAVSSLVNNKEIPATWQAQQRQATKSKLVQGARIWVVTYKNPAGKNANEQSLYLFFDELGNYIDANHTGELVAK